MNLFNCFQAMAFYTLSPFLAQYLFRNGYIVFGYISCVAIFAGFVTLSFMIEEKK